MGTRALLWAGLLILVVGIIFFLKYAFDNHWLSEPVRVALGILTGLAMLVSGRLRLKQYPVWAESLSGTGLTLLYISLTAAYRWYGLIGHWEVFFALCVVTVGSILLAILTNGWWLAFFSTLGGISVPFLIGYWGGFLEVLIYLAIFNMGIVFVFFRKQWRSMVWTALVGTWMMIVTSNIETDFSFLSWTYVGFVAISFLIFETAGNGFGIFKPDRYKTTELYLSILNAILFSTTCYYMLQKMGVTKQGLASGALGLAAYYAILGSAALRKTAPTLLTGFVSVLALGFIAAAMPLYLSHHWITMAWATQAIAVLWLSARIQNKSLAWIGLVLLGLLLARLLYWDSYLFTQTWTLILNKRSLAFLAVALAWFYFGLLHRQKKLPLQQKELSGIGGFVILILPLCWLSLEVIGYYSHQLWLQGLSQPLLFAKQIVLSIIWGVYAIGVLLFGFFKKQVLARWFSLCLLGITIIKVVFVDTTQISALYRMLIFLSLGGILLLGAYTYTRGNRKKGAST